MHFNAFVINLIEFRLAKTTENIGPVFTGCTTFIVLSILIQCSLDLGVSQKLRRLNKNSTYRISAFYLGYKYNDIYQYFD